MNLFKILQNGSGQINESNVSAFLGYLLDPYEDHGLKFEFLGRFLTPLEVSQPQDVSFNLEKQSIDVQFEFETKNDETDQKRFVDIALHCYDNHPSKKSGKNAPPLLSSEGHPKNVFLIENKISAKSFQKGQIRQQYLNSIKNEYFSTSTIYTVYITPDDQIFREEFEDFHENENKIHLFWKSNNFKYSIQEVLKEILFEESKGNIEAINQYTRHTLTSFIQFIENGFKSQKVEKAESSYKQDVYSDCEEFLQNYPELLNQDSKDRVTEFLQFLRHEFPSFDVRHSKTHPVSVFNHKKRIFTISGRGRNILYRLVLQPEHSENTIRKIELFLQNQSIKYKIEYWAITIFDKPENSLVTEQIQDVFKTYLKEIGQ